VLRRALLKILVPFANEYQRPAIYRRLLGVKVGRGARFTGTIHFGSEPYLITIGQHVTLADRVTFHTHDGGVWILRHRYESINIYARILIGDNVFIGSNVIILPGVTVGSNVIIGAGSVVTKSIPANSVFAGNPARFIRTIEEYEERALSKAIMVDSSNMKKAAGTIIAAVDERP
jgi:acetyltransferase-like isoleucine patch superfamily enzyme